MSPICVQHVRRFALHVCISSLFLLPLYLREALCFEGARRCSRQPSRCGIVCAHHEWSLSTIESTVVHGAWCTRCRTSIRPLRYRYRCLSIFTFHSSPNRAPRSYHLSLSFLCYRKRWLRRANPRRTTRIFANRLRRPFLFPSLNARAHIQTRGHQGIRVIVRPTVMFFDQQRHARRKSVTATTFCLLSALALMVWCCGLSGGAAAAVAQPLPPNTGMSLVTNVAGTTLANDTFWAVECLKISSAANGIVVDMGAVSVAVRANILPLLLPL